MVDSGFQRELGKEIADLKESFIQLISVKSFIGIVRSKRLLAEIRIGLDRTIRKILKNWIPRPSRGMTNYFIHHWFIQTTFARRLRYE